MTRDSRVIKRHPKTKNSKALERFFEINYDSVAAYPGKLFPAKTSATSAQYSPDKGGKDFRAAAGDQYTFDVTETACQSK
jgi:hypothetical protein